MFHHFNNLGQIYTTDYQINSERYPTLEGCNYLSPQLAQQAWKIWTIDYLEHCFTLAAPSKIPYRYKRR